MCFVILCMITDWYRSIRESDGRAISECSKYALTDQWCKFFLSITHSEKENEKKIWLKFLKTKRCKCPRIACPTSSLTKVLLEIWKLFNNTICHVIKLHLDNLPDSRRNFPYIPVNVRLANKRATWKVCKDLGELPRSFSWHIHA